MAAGAPDAVQSPTGLPVAVNVSGTDASGALYADHPFMGGGQGASTRGDGKSGRLYPTSAANTVIEVFEARVPVLVFAGGALSEFCNGVAANLRR